MAIFLTKKMSKYVVTFRLFRNCHKVVVKKKLLQLLFGQLLGEIWSLFHPSSCHTGLEKEERDNVLQIIETKFAKRTRYNKLHLGVFHINFLILSIFKIWPSLELDF